MPSKINFVVRLQHWMDSVPGQTFLNYAYSWGASIVILGALFKLTHLPGGNLMLFIGMGTEVVVFFLSAFDRPFDKTEVGRELPAEYETDEQIAARLGLTDDDAEQDDSAETVEKVETVEKIETIETIDNPVSPTQPAGQSVGGQSVVIVGGSSIASSAVQGAASPAVANREGDQATTEAAQTPNANSTDPVEAARAAIAAATPDGAQPFENEAQRLAAIIRAANDELLRRAQAVLSPEMEEATQVYIQKLQALAETFSKVDEQSARLTKDSVEMENLNRTLTGINKVYELHLKSISLQVGTIDQINGETQKLAQQIADLNAVYGRMIEALTVNMRGANGGAAAPAN